MQLVDTRLGFADREIDLRPPARKAWRIGQYVLNLFHAAAHSPARFEAVVVTGHHAQISATRRWISRAENGRLPRNCACVRPFRYSGWRFGSKRYRLANSGSKS